MRRWFSVDELPDMETACLVAIKDDCGRYITHPLSAAWDGKEWVDINGEKIDGVCYWQEIPVVDCSKDAIERLKHCIEKDTCEYVDCCYFASQADMAAVLKYIKKLEELQ